MLGRTRIDRCPFNAQSIGILIILLDKPVSEFLHGHAFFIGTIDHFIVDIGEILNVFHLVSAVFQVAAHRIEHDERTRISDMEIIVNGRSADVHGDLTLFDRDKRLLAPGHGIVNLHTVLLRLNNKYKRLIIIFIDHTVSNL